MRQTLLFLSFTLLLALTACQPDYSILDPVVPDPLDNISNPLSFSDEAYEILSRELNIEQDIYMPLPKIPAHFPRQPSARELTETQMRRAVLGRVLFYDTRLSATGETSCASCHQQKAAFGDNIHVSQGINGNHTSRNSWPLASVPSFATGTTTTTVQGYYAPTTTTVDDPKVKFFWDGRASNIMEQAIETMRNPVEMGMELEGIVDRLRNEPIYRVLAAKAYHTEELQTAHIIQSIGDFMTTMSSTDTRFDDLMDDLAAGQTEAQLLRAYSAQELRGATLFQQNCASCHSENLDRHEIVMANNGLEMDYLDQGNGAVTGDAMKNGMFKIPFLRNVALTAPYMHDGRFATLREVIDHYSDKLVEHPNLHRNLKNADGAAKQLHLSEEDKEALVKFLEMTTDRTIREAHHLSDPFIR
ncbi:cytochrome-c peroxidase [Lewinella sp. W8]|uniref:cytochrome-c peroxidase n=1 Tax=Lewinella sp. W8 TaxID=2528208 RepID=UPI001068BEFF|nr:cytochrome c peroxidase [Lewinella sp. W8]MTB51319.1 c-type cytochrome [Lewinella sp. W8]